MRGLEQKILQDLQRGQSDLIIAQTIVSTLQMGAEKYHMKLLTSSLSKLNLGLGMLNVASSFAESGLYAATGNKSQAKQLAEYGALDILGNLTAFEESSLSSIQNPLFKYTALSLRKAGVMSEYLLGGQATMLGITDIRQGEKAAGIGILASNVLDIAFAGRDAFSEEDHESDNIDYIGGGFQHSDDRNPDIISGFQHSGNERNSENSSDMRKSENDIPHTHEPYPILRKTTSMKDDTDGGGLSKSNPWIKPGQELLKIGFLGIVGAGLAQVTSDPNSLLSL